jgi:hypothetical protein
MTLVFVKLRQIIFRWCFFYPQFEWIVRQGQA